MNADTHRTKVAAISIRDHGPGGPADSLDCIFKPFYRLDPPHAGGGIGPGLSITQRAIALHNGKIQATNASPGFRVTVELKLIGIVP